MPTVFHFHFDSILCVEWNCQEVFFSSQFGFILIFDPFRSRMRFELGWNPWSARKCSGKTWTYFLLFTVIHVVSLFFPLLSIHSQTKCKKFLLFRHVFVAKKKTHKCYVCINNSLTTKKKRTKWKVYSELIAKMHHDKYDTDCE